MISVFPCSYHLSSYLLPSFKGESTLQQGENSKVPTPSEELQLLDKNINSVEDIKNTNDDTITSKNIFDIESKSMNMINKNIVLLENNIENIMIENINNSNNNKDNGWREEFDRCTADGRLDPEAWEYEIGIPRPGNWEAQEYTDQKRNAYCTDRGTFVIKAFCL